MRAIGPAVSWLCAIGTMPRWLTVPIAGLMPTTPLTAAGHTIEPSVSVPTASGASRAATATAEPLEEPHGLRSSTYGLRVWPPRLLQPLVDFVERKFAHSLKFVLPSTTAPAARSLATTSASARARCSASASEPALVAIASAVSMFALSSTGTPCSGPSAPPLGAARRAARAIASASGLISMTAAEHRPRVVERRDPAQIGLRDLQRRDAARRELGAQRDRIERHDVGIVSSGSVRAQPSSASSVAVARISTVLRHAGQRPVGEGNDRSGTLPSPPCPLTASSPTAEAARRTTTC